MALSKLMSAATIAAAVMVVGALPAAAKCTKLGFTVNDYGKDGPTKDAKALLDKHIAQWAAQNGIAKYTTGKKDVSCELFLDFGFFDEHTCKASATVCWGDGSQTAAAPASTTTGTPKVKAKKVSAPKAEPAAAIAGPGTAAKAAVPAKAEGAAAGVQAPAKKAPAKAPPPVKAKDPS